MSKYTENNLQKDEKIVYKAKINPIAAIDKIILCVVFIIAAIVLFVYAGKIVSQMEADTAKTMKLVIAIAGILIMLIGIIPLVFRLLDLFMTDIAVTNKRVIGKRGIVRIKTVDLHIDKVDTVKIEASFWGRIFKYYKLSVMGTGSAEPVWFVGISNANEFKNEVNNAIEQHAAEARAAQAAEMAAAMAAASASKSTAE